MGWGGVWGGGAGAGGAGGAGGGGGAAAEREGGENRRCTRHATASSSGPEIWLQLFEQDFRSNFQNRPENTSVISSNFRIFRDSRFTFGYRNAACKLNSALVEQVPAQRTDIQLVTK